MTEAKAPRIRVAALIAQGDALLLVEHEKAGKRYWLLPGGGVEYGEGLVEALERELIEETGLTVKVGDLVLALDSIDPAGSRHVVNLVFIGTIRSGELSPETGGRVVGAQFVPLERFMALDVRPAMQAEVAEVLALGHGARYLGVRWRPE